MSGSADLVLAIDLGTKRVGLALSDEGGRFATPYEVLEVSSPEDAAARVLEVARREGAQRLVLGLLHASTAAAA